MKLNINVLSYMYLLIGAFLMIVGAIEFGKYTDSEGMFKLATIIAVIVVGMHCLLDNQKYTENEK